MASRSRRNRSQTDGNLHRSDVAVISMLVNGQVQSRRAQYDSRCAESRMQLEIPYVRGVFTHSQSSRHIAKVVLAIRHDSLAPCSGPSRRGLATLAREARQARRPTLTVPARGAPLPPQFGTKERPPGTNKGTAQNQEVIDDHSAGENGPHCSARARPSLPSGHAIRALRKDLRTDVPQLADRSHGWFTSAAQFIPTALNFSADATPAAQQLDRKSAPKCTSGPRCHSTSLSFQVSAFAAGCTSLPIHTVSLYRALSQREEPFLHTPSSEAGLRPSWCCRKGDPRYPRTNRCR